MNKKIILVGFDIEILELVESFSEKEILGYTDIEKAECYDITYLGKDNEFIESFKFDNDIEAIITVDKPELRNRLFELYIKNICSFMCSKSSKISHRANIGLGSVIQSDVFVSASVKIGKCCLLNHSSSVHHESQIGDFSILAPKCTVLGRVVIGEKTYIGAGAVIKNNVRIGSNVIIGAGAVVVSDIKDNSVVVGNPAEKYINRK